MNLRQYYAQPDTIWCARLDSLCWRVVGCSVWDLAAADEGEAMRYYARGEKPSVYLRAILKT